MPSRQPRKPSIGLNSCSALTRSAMTSGETPSSLGHLCLALVVVRQELVQRRVERADRHRLALHRLEQALEIVPLERQQLGQRLACGPRPSRPGSSRASARCGRRTCARCGTGRCLRRRTRWPASAWSGLSALVRILQLADRVGPVHQLGELLIDLRLLRLQRLVDQHLHDLARLGGDLAGHDLAGEAVDADVSRLP